MRRILLMMMVVLSAFAVQAQNSDNFSCFDESTHRTQFAVTPPDISDDNLDITITALGYGNYEPIIGITDSEDITDCYFYSPEAEFYDISLPTGAVPLAFTNATGVAFIPGENTVQVGNLNDDSGAFVLVLEGFLFETEHRYHMTLTEDMLQAGENLNAYLVSLVDDYEPSLTITDSEDTETIAEPSEVTMVSIFGEGTVAVSAPLPDIAGDVELTVNPNMPGVYALILELQTGAIQSGDGLAEVILSEDGALTLTCDGATIFENGLRVTVPDDNSYTATVLADAIDPVMAVLDDADTGVCIDDSPSALDYSIELPDIIIEYDIVYPAAEITPQDASFVFGGVDNLSGNYVLVIEGGEVGADEAGDIFEIMLTENDVLTAYVFTTQLELDPVLTWLLEDGGSIVCNDAGIPDLCDQELELFNDSSLNYGEDLSLLGIDYNPMLEIPLDATVEPALIRLQVTANAETAGEYILVLHIVTD